MTLLNEDPRTELNELQAFSEVLGRLMGPGRMPPIAIYKVFPLNVQATTLFRGLHRGLENFGFNLTTRRGEWPRTVLPR